MRDRLGWNLPDGVQPADIDRACRGAAALDPEDYDDEALEPPPNAEWTYPMKPWIPAPALNDETEI